MKRKILTRAGGVSIGFPRLLRRGPIEAVPVAQRLDRHTRFPRLLRRGPIEARDCAPAATKHVWQFPRLLRRGPIEARDKCSLVSRA